MTIDSTKGFVPNYSWFSLSRVLPFTYIRPVRVLHVYTCRCTLYIIRIGGSVRQGARATERDSERTQLV